MDSRRCRELNCITSDDYGNVYIGNYYNVAKYKFIVADKNGNILHRENNDEYHSDILNLEIEDNKLKISYVTNEIKEFDISSFKPVDAKVVLNGDTVKFDQPPVVIDGRTLVPVRAVIEAMDGQVGWDEATQTATLSLNGNVIKLIIGNTNAYLNDEAKTLDVAPQVINDRTLLPIRFVAEGFGFNVDWNEDTSSVIINGDVSQIVNKELLNCIGKTKREIVDMYGRIVDSEYIIGGKYYIHERMKTEMFYENDDNAYDYNIHDDANENSTCLSLIAKLDELIKVQDKIYYSIDDLQSVFGKYEFENYLDDENFPSCYYRFEYGDYSLSIESDRLNPKVQYISVYKENQ